jgi:hypothetical protein
MNRQIEKHERGGARLDVGDLGTIMSVVVLTEVDRIHCAVFRHVPVTP